MSGHQPGHESGATPASGLALPSTGTRPAPPPLPWPQRPIRRREPDRVRHAALGLAVEALHGLVEVRGVTPEHVADQCVHVAKAFEAYLEGGGQP